MSEAAAMLVRFWGPDGYSIRQRPGLLVPPIGALVKLGMRVWAVVRVEADYDQLVVDVHVDDPAVLEQSRQGPAMTQRAVESGE